MYHYIVKILAFVTVAAGRPLVKGPPPSGCDLPKSVAVPASLKRASFCFWPLHFACIDAGEASGRVSVAWLMYWLHKRFVRFQHLQGNHQWTLKALPPCRIEKASGRTLAPRILAVTHVHKDPGIGEPHQSFPFS